MSSIAKFIEGRLLGRGLIFSEEVFFGHLFNNRDLNFNKVFCG